MSRSRVALAAVVALAGCNAGKITDRSTAPATAAATAPSVPVGSTTAAPSSSTANPSSSSTSGGGSSGSTSGGSTSPPATSNTGASGSSSSSSPPSSSGTTSSTTATGLPNVAGHWVGTWRETNPGSGSTWGAGSGPILFDIVEDANGNLTGTGRIDGCQGGPVDLTIKSGKVGASGKVTLKVEDVYHVNLLTMWGPFTRSPDKIDGQYTMDGGPFVRNAGYFTIHR